MRKLVSGVFAVCIGFMCAGSIAGEVTVEDARVDEIVLHGSYYNTNVFLVVFDKTAGGCAGMWVDTWTQQGERAYQALLSAFTSRASVDYAMDPDKPWAGASSSLICEMRYMALKNRVVSSKVKTRAQH